MFSVKSIEQMHINQNKESRGHFPGLSYVLAEPA